MTSKEIADSLRERVVDLKLQIDHLQDLIRTLDPPRVGRPRTKVTDIEDRRPSA